ncbi:hypothetical protein MCHI_002083 [Candidatus Magnetoovum chiemensis]|nr:hypothetical protein MCHI_002083 [Candidatus Magnetoovum chiemensis]
MDDYKMLFQTLREYWELLAPDKEFDLNDKRLRDDLSKSIGYETANRIIDSANSYLAGKEWLKTEPYRAIYNYIKEKTSSISNVVDVYPSEIEDIDDPEEKYFRIVVVVKNMSLDNAFGLDVSLNEEIDKEFPDEYVFVEVKCIKYV